MASDRAEAQDIHCRRLRWRSRRGMLELELVLAPFVAARLDGLSAADQALFEKLLDHDDCLRVDSGPPGHSGS